VGASLSSLVLISHTHEKEHVYTSVNGDSLRKMMNVTHTPHNEEISSTSTSTNSKLLDALRSLSATEEDALLEELHGHEFPYPLTCPKQTFTGTTYSLLVGYHGGMLKNWNSVFKDQLHILHRCGLGSVLSKLFITFFNDYRNESEHSSNEDYVPTMLQAELQRYPNLASKATILRSHGQPIEGTAIANIHA
jgi:hypothetical protein